MIVSVDDLRRAFRINQIITEMTDDDLEDLIQLQTDSILAELGVSLEPQVHEFTYYDERPVMQVVLPIKYGLDVDTVHVNGHRLHSDEYHLDKENGIVYLHPHFHHHHHGIYHKRMYNHFKSFKVDIVYITVLPEYIKNKLKPLIIDVILYNQIPEAKKGIRRVTEGDTTIEYDKNTTITYLSAHRISTQLKGIRQLLYPSTTIMI